MGTRLAHYVIEAVLGQGGMGTVYRARDTQLDRVVAIKVLADSTGDTRHQLLREARAASALSHAAIVTVHSIEQQADTDFIVMEFVEGRSLADEIPAGGLPIPTAIDYAVQIAAALAAAHRAGVVHRDIKPANVMVTPSRQVKVLDFGVARHVRIDPADATRSATYQGTVAPPGSIIGTVGYMAPEQIAGEKAYAPSDVFAFGVVLYQMCTGARPFTGDTKWSVMDATVHSEPRALTALRPDAPVALANIVQRCLAKNPAERYQSGEGVLAALQEVRAASAPTPIAASRRLSTITIAAAIVLAAAGIGAILWARVREQRVTSAKSAAAEIVRLVNSGDAVGAYRLATQEIARNPADPDLQAAFSSVARPMQIVTNPVGAEVAFRAYDGADAGWISLGRTPLPDTARFPFNQLRWRITKDGYTPLEASPNEAPFRFELVPANSAPPGMVHVPAGTFDLERDNHSVAIREFWIDQYEVTNGQFKEFVDRGGYRQREYSPHPIVDNGHELSWDEAMARFRDTTGRPGPSTWELGTYPEGQEDYPVSGVSWYEAAAYASFARKSLPTAYHWYKASGAFGIFSEILPHSNFAGKGTARVGSYKGLGPYGTYDMAGNVKEWCWNQATPGKRYVLGGAYNDATYQFRDQDARAAMERAAGFGFRCVKQDTPIDAKLLDPIVSFERDTSTLKPVDDAVFAAYRRLYDYDPTPLEASVESEDKSDPNWTRQRVSFRAAYGNERVPAVMFIPKTARPPYQAVVYFPGSDAVMSRSSRTQYLLWLEFLVRSGRLVIFPIYQQTYERRTEMRPTGQNSLREIGIQRAQDLRRAVDYLQSRSDIDHEKIAGYGLSLGAQLMPVYLAVEPRLKTGVLLSGGFETWNVPPEWDPVNFASRVRQPVLMVNGREDFDLPYQTAQVPLFNMLARPRRTSGTPSSRAATFPRSPNSSTRKSWTGWTSIWVRCGRASGPAANHPAHEENPENATDWFAHSVF